MVITALVTAINAYWDPVAAKESVRAAEQALVAARKLAEQNREQMVRFISRTRSSLNWQALS